MTQPSKAPISYSNTLSPVPAVDATISWSRVVWLCILFALIWFLPLGYRHLVPSDEGRYAEMAREMFVTGDWITPRYNGYKYFEKPPLQTWANALSFAWFGVGEWQARLYTALCGYVGVLLTAYTALRVYGARTGAAAGLILASAPYWNLMGHFNTLDMGLSFWMTVTLCALLLAQRAGTTPRATRAWMWLSWAGMAMAVLSKGLVGLLLPGSVLILYSILYWDWALWRRMAFGSGVIVFLLISVPWFILVQIRNPDFFHYFFIVQQFQRYLTPDQHRPGPLYYFIPVLLVGFLPWLGWVWRAFRVRSASPALAKPLSDGMPVPTAPYAVGTTSSAATPPSPARLAPKPFHSTRFLVIWTVFIFVFFSASHSKLISYVLPVAPSIAVLLARAYPSLTRVQWRRHLLVFAALIVIGALGAVKLTTLGDNVTPPALYKTYFGWVEAALAVGLIFTLVAMVFNRRGRLSASVTMFAVGWLLITSIAGAGHETFGRQSSGADLAPAVQQVLEKLPADTPFYSVNRLDHTMPFYIGHTMIMVESADELTFGVHAEPSKWVPTLAQWKAQWLADKYALALLTPGYYQTLRDAGFPMTVIASDPRRVIVEKPAS